MDWRRVWVGEGVVGRGKGGRDTREEEEDIFDSFSWMVVGWYIYGLFKLALFSIEGWFGSAFIVLLLLLFLF